MNKDGPTLPDGVSRIELAGLSFDQWNLCISLREYHGDEVVGMASTVFPSVRGFRYLDEGDMQAYPFPHATDRKYYYEANENGWLAQELGHGNIAIHDCIEYVIETDNECLCILADIPPTFVRDNR